jgi:tripartite-type tricarboxylate transporter receptor subunit TctC
MNVSRRDFVYLAATAFGGLATSPFARAESYPSRPVRVVVPFAPGGIDVPIRLIAHELSERLNQQFIIENVAGGGTSRGTTQVARAIADGYTVLFTTSALVTYPLLHSKAPFHPFKDFAPVTDAAVASLILLVNSSAPVHTVKELAAYIKRNPAKYSYASVGFGTPPHLTGELFRQALGVDLVHVPYHSGGEATASVMAGTTLLCFTSVAPAVAQVKAGKLRALAVAGKTRVQALPDVPTMTEEGYPNIEGEVWCGALVPAGTPNDIITGLYDQIAKVLARPALKARLAAIGYTTVGNNPAEFAEQLKTISNRIDPAS